MDHYTADIETIGNWLDLNLEGDDCISADELTPSETDRVTPNDSVDSRCGC
ncbi:hypothetical protein CLV72_106410 [Allonocardiopsis opalescens]|uniref:Uncharacterized protein n=1 Tax=Allonocardiopsis opalescens TaxID=1144618 RepID=A0A2T0Q0P9_9ACTN|nr:hypothetical protein CLV72_106410 [Allonocardiopsis opalescens]